MRTKHPLGYRALGMATDAAALAFAPVLLFVGDSLTTWAKDQRKLSRPHRATEQAVADHRFPPVGTMSVPRGLIATSVVVNALGAPQRWVRDRLGAAARRRTWVIPRRPPDDGGPWAGVREPRRPLPTLPGARLARQVPGSREE